MNLKEKAESLKKDIPAVFVALKDKRTPAVAKILAAVTVAYALSPVDLIPDFIPLLGYLDDILLLPALIALTVRLIPENIWAESREKARAMWTDGRPEKWYYAVPTVLIWLIILWLIIKAILF